MPYVHTVPFGSGLATYGALKGNIQKGTDGQTPQAQTASLRREAAAVGDGMLASKVFFTVLNSPFKNGSSIKKKSNDSPEIHASSRGTAARRPQGRAEGRRFLWPGAPLRFPSWPVASSGPRDGQAGLKHVCAPESGARSPRHSPLQAPESFC